MAETVGSLPKRGLKRVEIDCLFGRYDYELGNDQDGLSEVAILYGDNGCGKTTILNLLFHLLSAANNRGHRNAISRTPFKRVRVDLHDGTSVVASRNAEPDALTYEMSFRSPNREPIEVQFNTETKSRIQPPERESEYLKFLADLELSLYLVSADREILSDEWPAQDPEEEWMSVRHHQRTRSRDRALQQLRRLSLEQAIDFANNWIRRQAVSGTNVGSGSANEIYERIINRIAESPLPPADDEPTNADMLAETLRELATRNERYSEYQLTSPLRVSSLIDRLSQSEGQTRSMISRVLEPYIEGTRARLDALEAVQRITEAFVRNFNEFFVDKTVSFDMTAGLQISTQDGIRLEPGLLSSGEQQLLRLFCHTIVSRDRASIFIIDEPELSLNVKWQRKLIGALLELVEGSEMQFVLATHSLELLAQHRESVVRLGSSE